MIPSLPNINKQSFETPGAEDSGGNRYFSMDEIITECVMFNNGKALFRPKSDERTAYGAEENKSYVKHKDGHLVELKIHRTISGHRKAYIKPTTLTDIGHKSFRSTSASFQADTKDKRIQLYVLPSINGVERNRKITENMDLAAGHRYKLLAVRIKDGQIFDYWKGNKGMNLHINAPGDYGYPIIDVLKNVHPLPAEDGYYVFVFSFGYITGEGTIDDTAYHCFFAKVA